MELKIRDDVVGFGDDASKRGRTVNSNYFIRFETKPCAGGADVTLVARHGLRFEDGSTSVRLHLRKDTGPRIGERVMIRKRLVKVADKHIDHEGRLMVMDEDTHAWYYWDERS